MPGKKILVKLVGHDAHTAYVALPGHRRSSGVIAKTVELNSILAYEGPRVHLDLDKKGKLIGIEILAKIVD